MSSPSFQTPTKDWSAQVLAGKKVSAATLQREYELGDILDYIKTGIASVIEDEVTQRFVAEELKVRENSYFTPPSIDFRLTIFAHVFVPMEGSIQPSHMF